MFWKNEIFNCSLAFPNANSNTNFYEFLSEKRKDAFGNIDASLLQYFAIPYREESERKPTRQLQFSR